MQTIQSPSNLPSSKTITEQTPPRGLSANWRMVDGKLVCAWFKNPD